VNFELLTLLLALALSAFCSGSEIAFTALNPAHILLWLKEERIGARRTEAWFHEPNGFLITVLVGTNLANIAFTSLGTLFLLKSTLPEWAIFPVITLTVLFFGELLPKLFFHAVRHKVFPVLAIPIIILRVSIWLLVWPLEILVDALGSRKRSGPILGLRGHLGQLFHQAGDSGLIGQQESELIEKTLALKEGRLSDVMTPRVDIVALPINGNLDDLANLASKGFSKIPVYRDTIDSITGYVALRDLFNNPKSLEEMLRPISFYPKGTDLRGLLGEAHRHRWKMAVVLDEYGGTAGLVTLEDLIEEVVGEIQDEHDAPSLRLITLQDGRSAVDARMAPEQVFASFNRPEPQNSFETIGGWLVDQIGRIPVHGESFKREGLQFIIAAAGKNRIHQLIIEKQAEADEGA
jgi:putative hemolysin